MIHQAVELECGTRIDRSQSFFIVVSHLLGIGVEADKKNSLHHL